MADTIPFSDFTKIDIRIGTVIDAVVPEWSHWVMKLTVDFGDPPAGGGTKTIFSGIMKFYTPEEMKGKQFPFVVNLESKKIGPKDENGVQGYSEGMLMAASVVSESGNPEEDKPVLLHIAEAVPNGTKVI
jgi:tRNA-binding EMAP/Myf-like protein